MNAGQAMILRIDKYSSKRGIHFVKFESGISRSEHGKQSVSFTAISNEPQERHVQQHCWESVLLRISPGSQVSLQNDRGVVQLSNHWDKSWLYFDHFNDWRSIRTLFQKKKERIIISFIQIRNIHITWSSKNVNHMLRLFPLSIGIR